MKLATNYRLPHLSLSLTLPRPHGRFEGRLVVTLLAHGHCDPAGTFRIPLSLCLVHALTTLVRAGTPKQRLKPLPLPTAAEQTPVVLGIPLSLYGPVLKTNRGLCGRTPRASAFGAGSKTCGDALMVANGVFYPGSRRFLGHASYYV